jgi:hypothetical protein
LIKLFGHDQEAMSGLAQVLSALLMDACSTLKTVQQVRLMQQQLGP